MNNKNEELSIKNSDIEAKVKLKLDKDITKLLEASEKTGIPLTFRGDRIIDFKVYNNNKWEDIEADQIEIGPSAIFFDLKFGDITYDEIPFDRLNITDDFIIFNSTFYAALDIKIKFKIKFNEKEDKTTFNISISPKSNKINDLLNYELRKREFSNNNFSIKFSGYDQEVFEGYFPEGESNKVLIEFFQKVDYINDKLNLNLIIAEDYNIKQDDLDCADSICKYIKNKKIPLTNISIGMEVNSETLHKIIYNDERKLVLEENMHIVKLLGNEINLGLCKVTIDDYVILNEEELVYHLESIENSNETKHITLVLKEKNSDRLYLDFSK